MSKINEIKYNNFGSEMIVDKYRKYSDIDVYFPKYKWTAKHKTYKNFKDGNVKCPYEPRSYNIGYIGEGIYKAKENGKDTKMYIVWHEMLKRCYSEKYHKKNNTYEGCEVCDEWHNFQNFAEWYEENYYEIPGEVMALDKDILVKGNKIYSPNTCIFVPQSINTLFIKSDKIRGNLPIGVHYKKQNKKYIAQCKMNNEKKYLGSFDTPEEAFQVYKKFKERYIKQIADEYIELIPQELYNAMHNYEIEYED